VGHPISELCSLSAALGDPFKFSLGIPRLPAGVSPRIVFSSPLSSTLDREGAYHQVDFNPNS
jgi:hypothetical protein